MKDRDTFSSKTGFVLACVGSAVGLGNLWLFPWRVGQYGGGAFLVLYLVFVYVLGTTGLMGEYGLGRWAGSGPMSAFDKILRGKGLRFGRVLGAYPVLAALCILMFYGIVTGWVVRYLVASISGAYFGGENLGAFFESTAGQPMSIVWHVLALAAGVGVMVFGISRGVERVNKVIIPALFVLFLVLVVRSVTLPGALEGVKYLFIPDWSYLAKPITWGMALGQAFFTVSLAGSGMVVYGSYMKKDMDVPSAALQTVSFDTVAALLAALVIVPAAFASGVDVGAGPALLFITVPEIFATMAGGRIFSILFFLGVFFAAISSLFNLMEVSVEALQDQFTWSRKVSVVVVAGVALVGGLPLDINMGWFIAFVDLITVYLAPLGAAMAAVLFFWVHSVKEARRIINVGAARPLGAWWEPVAKYLFVGVSLLIVVLQMLFRVG